MPMFDWRNIDCIYWHYIQEKQIKKLAQAIEAKKKRIKATRTPMTERKAPATDLVKALSR